MWVGVSVGMGGWVGVHACLGVDQVSTNQPRCPLPCKYYVVTYIYAMLLGSGIFKTSSLPDVIVDLKQVPELCTVQVIVV